MSAHRDPTLSEALAAAGYTHRRLTDDEARQGATQYARAIVDRDGRVVGYMTAGAAWEWLRGERC